MPAEADERIDVLDQHGHATGVTKRRADVHRAGDWHRTLHLWVVHPDGCVLLQRRALSKDLSGGLVDVSVAGHLREGETVLDLLREAEEEIGLELRPGELEYLETIRSERVYAGGIVDRELQDVYATLVEGRSLEQYSFRCDEVEVLYEVPLARAIALYRGGEPTAAAGWDCMGRPNNALLVADDLIAQARADTLASLERLATWMSERPGSPPVTSER